MKVTSPDLKKIAAVSVVLVIVLYVFGEFVLQIPSTQMPYKTGLILGIIGLYWVYFDTAGWKYDFFRIWNWVTDIPNLNGRYEGYVDRRGENNPHDFVMEIKQTFSKIIIYTYSKNSRGNSITAKLATDELSTKYYLFINWQARTKSLTKHNEMDDFFGTSIIEISKNGKKYKFRDDYYTRRNPPTRGVTELEWKSKDLKNCF